MSWASDWPSCFPEDRCRKLRWLGGQKKLHSVNVKSFEHNCPLAGNTWKYTIYRLFPIETLIYIGFPIAMFGCKVTAQKADSNWS